MRGYRRIFKKHGYTALRAARDDGKWSNKELAEQLGYNPSSVNVIFCKAYTEVSWKRIVHVAEILGVAKEDYIRKEYLLNLPIEVELYFRGLEGITKPTPTKKPRRGRPAKIQKPITVEGVKAPAPMKSITGFRVIKPAYLTMLNGLEFVESVTVKTKNGTITWEA
jgi:transcriptional regulator with XRE-family HTH domain